MSDMSDMGADDAEYGLERATGFEPSTLGLGSRLDVLSPPFADVWNLRQYRVLQSLEISLSFVVARYRSSVKRWLQGWWIPTRIAINPSVNPGVPTPNGAHRAAPKVRLRPHTPPP